MGGAGSRGRGSSALAGAGLDARIEFGRVRRREERSLESARKGRGLGWRCRMCWSSPGTRVILTCTGAGDWGGGSWGLKVEVEQGGEDTPTELFLFLSVF